MATQATLPSAMTCPIIVARILVVLELFREQRDLAAGQDRFQVVRAADPRGPHRSAGWSRSGNGDAAAPPGNSAGRARAGRSSPLPGSRDTRESPGKCPANTGSSGEMKREPAMASSSKLTPVSRSTSRNGSRCGRMRLMSSLPQARGVRESTANSGFFRFCRRSASWSTPRRAAPWRSRPR